MAQYRMIAIDLDGTLLSPTGEVTPRVKAAVRKALDAGLLICFATGRNWTESRTVIEAVEHYSTAVFVGGAIVIDTEKQVTLHRMLMGSQLAAEVCASLEAQGQAALALQDTEVTGVDYLVSGHLPLNEATRQWIVATASVVHEVPRLGEHSHEHTVRVGICATPEVVRQVMAVLVERFGERITAQGMNVPAFGVEVLEVFDAAVNKWQGLLHVARHHDIDPAQIIAIGDGVNDLPMIENAGLGVAMGNARPEVMAVADRVIGSNQDEGLAAFLEELVEQHVVDPER